MPWEAIGRSCGRWASPRRPGGELARGSAPAPPKPGRGEGAGVSELRALLVDGRARGVRRLVPLLLGPLLPLLRRGGGGVDWCFRIQRHRAYMCAGAE